MPGNSFRRWLAGWLIVSAGAAAAQQGPDGLRAAAAEALWPTLQARVTASTVSSLRESLAWGTSSQGNGLRRVESFSVLGDYYFAAPELIPGSSGGFRATSGLIFGQASSRVLSAYGPSASRLYAAPGVLGSNGLDGAASGTLPYLGLGYTSVSMRAGWGFSADIGMVARQASSAVKLGRVMGGGQALDDVIREMRLSPLLNLGVSYSF